MLELCDWSHRREREALPSLQCAAARRQKRSSQACGLEGPGNETSNDKDTPLPH